MQKNNFAGISVPLVLAIILSLLPCLTLIAHVQWASVFQGKPDSGWLRPAQYLAAVLATGLFVLCLRFTSDRLFNPRPCHSDVVEGSNSAAKHDRRSFSSLVTFSILISSIATLFTLIASLLLGIARFGPKTLLIITDSQRIIEDAQQLWGMPVEMPPPQCGISVLCLSSISFDSYGRPGTAQAPLVPNLTFPTGDLFEDFGIPFRCIRTPVPNSAVTGLPDASEILHMVSQHLVNMRLLPSGLIAGSMFWTLVFLLIPGVYRVAQRSYFQARSRCIYCGYTLAEHRLRCPECGRRC